MTPELLAELDKKTAAHDLACLLGWRKDALEAALRTAQEALKEIGSQAKEERERHTRHGGNAESNPWLRSERTLLLTGAELREIERALAAIDKALKEA